TRSSRDWSSDVCSSDLCRMSSVPLAAPEPTLSSFGRDPWWLIDGKVLAIFVFLVLTVMLTMWAERGVLGRMQLRVGPNRAGPFEIGRASGRAGAGAPGG